ncbi:MAG: hypothetical protein RIE56_07460 [Amphiplicatus sp.]
MGDYYRKRFFRRIRRRPGKKRCLCSLYVLNKDHTDANGILFLKREFHAASYLFSSICNSCRARLMRRLYLTAREREALLDAQGGECCVDDCHETEGLIAEHSNPNFFRSAKPDQLMCQACHKVKSLKDTKTIARAKRLSAVTMTQYERRKKFGSALKGRPFQKRGE